MKISLFGEEYRYNKERQELSTWGSILTPYLVDGKQYVSVKENGKPIRVEYGLVLLRLYGKFYLPEYLWSLVTCDYLDDDPNNLDISNLYVTYPDEGIEHPDFKGFRYIPGYELNVINDKGIVIRLSSKKVVTPAFPANRKEQYVKSTIDINSDRVSGRVTHRLLGLAFKGTPKGYPKLQVHHKDHNKANFDLDNLEWATPLKNNVEAHKAGVRTDSRPVDMMDWETGKVSSYYSQWDLVKQNAITQPTLATYLIYGGKFKGRYSYKYANDTRSWETVSIAKVIPNDFKGKHVITGEVITVNGVNNAIALFKSSGITIHQQCTGNAKQKLLLNGYEVKYLDDTSDWHEFDEYHRTVYELGMPPDTPVYEVKHLETKQTQTLYGVPEATKAIGCSKRHLIIYGTFEGRVIKSFYVKRVK